MQTQVFWLFILAIPIAFIAWTVTQEELFREPRDYCIGQSKKASHLARRKLFYLFTCEYCFSHYVTLVAVIFTGFKLLLPDWRGYIIAGFALVWVANCYMNIYAFLRQGIKKEKTEIKKLEEDVVEL